MDDDITGMVFDNKKLKRAREHLGMSRQEMATRIYVRDAVYRDWELGKEAPSEVWLRRIASVIDCRPEDLARRWTPP